MPSSKPIGSRIATFCAAPSADQLEHESLLILQLRGARQHRADLIDQQNGKRHDRHAEEFDGHLPKHIALQNSQKALIRQLRLRLQFQ